MTTLKHFAQALALILLALAAGARAQEPAAEAEAPAPQETLAPTGSGTAGKIPKWTSSTNLGNSVVTESYGKVGVNISSPAARLHVYGPTPPAAAADGADAALLLRTTGGRGGDTTGTTGQAAGNGASISLYAGRGGDAPAGSKSGNGGNIFIQPGLAGGGAGLDGSPGKVLIGPAGVGNVGIGTFSPTAKLHVNTGLGTGIRSRSAGSVAISGESPHYIAVYGESETDIGVYGYSSKGTGVYGSSTTGLAGEFNGKVQVKGTLTATGNVCADNVPCASDARLKRGVADLGYGLNQLLRLRPVSWRWKSEPEGQLQLGLVAQEVETVMPELVTREADPAKPLGLNYMALLPVAVKAIQEQQKLIEQQARRNEAQARQIEQLQAQLNQVRRAVRRRASKR
jgi:hypothetical protein